MSDAIHLREGQPAITSRWGERGEVTLELFDATGERCYCSECLTPAELAAVTRWLERLPQPPEILFDPPREPAVNPCSECHADLAEHCHKMSCSRGGEKGLRLGL